MLTEKSCRVYSPIVNWKKRNTKVSKEGYILVYVPEHPKAFKGWYYEHRLIIEKKIGRILETSETIHHINENKEDNRLNNLFLCSREEHDKAHVHK